MTTELPVYLLPDFDPSKIKIAELRGILLAHGVIYTSNAKKAELVTLFKTRIVPLIPRLIREHAAVRASDDGVLDGNSLDGSLRELDTDPEEFPDSDHSSLTSKKHTKKSKSKRKSMVGRAHEAAEAQEEGEVAEKRRKGRKSVRMSSREPEYEEIPDQHDVIVPLAGEGNASPKKRKAAAPPSGDEGTPRTSSILKSRRSTIQSEGEGGFSDYNPFQSGGEDTPGRDPKRRKSSLGGEKLKESKSTSGFERSSPPPQDDPAPLPTPASSRKSTSSANLAPPVPSPAKPSASTSRPDLTTSNSWSSATPEEARQRLLDPDRYKSSPAPSSSRSTPITSTSKGKARESVGTPVGVKYMVPLEKVKTTPPETQRLMREYEAIQRREAEEEKRKREQEEEELGRQREEQEIEMEFERDELGDVEMDPIEDALEEEMEIEEQDDFAGEEEDPFEGGEVGEFEEDDFEGEEESLFEEEAPAPPQVVAALRQTSTPRRSEPLPYSPRQAQAQALAQTPRRSLPFPTPPSSVITKRRPSSKLDQTISLRPTSSSLVASSTARTIKHVSTWSLLLLTIIYSLWWREEKLSAGFCDTNSSVNSLVLHRQTSLALPQLPSSLCTTLSALHLRPSCTPCPTHGHCEASKFLGCTLDYVPRSSPLRLGGLLPVPPKCVPDTEKLMVVAMQASRASKLLRKRRGEVVCYGGVEGKRRKIIAHGGESGKGHGDREAFVFGLQAESVLSALMRENEASKSPFSEEVLEELNRLALSDLVNHGEVLTWQDGEDYWYASKTAEMPLSCQARLAAIKSAKKHKTGLAGVLSALLSMLYLRYKLQARVQEKQLVAELVQTALVQLQRQERAHHADPVHVPFAHIAPSQLRDLVLQHVHSPSRRAQLWKRVEKVVEGNSNVRVMEVEQNGEELRGWQWVGATGAREIESASGQQSSPEKVMVERVVEEKPMMQQQKGRRIFGVL